MVFPLPVGHVPSSASHQAEAAIAPEDEFGAKDYRSMVQLKPDHKLRPLWVVGGVGN